MLFCLPGLRTVVKQVQLVIPPNVSFPGQHQMRHVYDDLRKAERPWAARVALQVMRQHTAPFNTLLQTRVKDPGNSLYDFLELLANWGNLVNRMLGFANKRFDGAIPAPGTLTDESLLSELLGS